MNSCKGSGVTGSQFTLSVMSDDFVDVILTSLHEVNTSMVWKKTDDVSTCIRGKSVHVFDVLEAIFLHAAKTGKHVVIAGTVSTGCPGSRDTETNMDVTDKPQNKLTSQEISQQAGCKFAIYPLGSENYMDVIINQIDRSKLQKVQVSSDYYATRLDGDVKDIFQTMHEFFRNVQQEISHVSMTFTVSANSPSNKGGAANG